MPAELDPSHVRGQSKSGGEIKVQSPLTTPHCLRLPNKVDQWYILVADGYWFALPMHGDSRGDSAECLKGYQPFPRLSQGC